jgi:hypothetical protein
MSLPTDSPSVFSYQLALQNVVDCNVKLQNKFFQNAKSNILRAITKEYYDYFALDQSYVFSINATACQVLNNNFDNSYIVSEDVFKLNYNVDLCKYNTLNKIANITNSNNIYPKTANNGSTHGNIGSSLFEYTNSIKSIYKQIFSQIVKLPTNCLRPYTFYAEYQILDYNTNLETTKISICSVSKYIDSCGCINYNIVGTGVIQK